MLQQSPTWEDSSFVHSNQLPLSFGLLTWLAGPRSQFQSISWLEKSRNRTQMDADFKLAMLRPRASCPILYLSWEQRVRRFRNRVHGHSSWIWPEINNSDPELLETYSRFLLKWLCKDVQSRKRPRQILDILASFSQFLRGFSKDSCWFAEPSY